MLRPFPIPGTVLSSRTIILIRGSSYSLVDIPTFLPANYTVSNRPTGYSCKCDPTVNTEISLALVLADYKPKKKLLQASSQWTVMFIAISLFTTCLLLVGVMLSFTTEYQDIAIARMLNISTF